ncbi:MAG TPA: bifunctional phosphopantothenoylcysteine decarboxylase/phosphopantothenate--cysteine ligase CoaBC [Cyclobacteriaceae bacterium]|jgi:phosphopantothenoylcysteine decarboxylase/phosphopantothenate--cysteine ligase|nr:bifunctional phosphopantothenoylcysteine decarboxylase/phosphopantothenate--cysteine ligase CoaBC [Cytophagales bacterium]HMR55764.1 bifunctional phosphopantothenoylcysteine decarboxylase/phosphopantothenate--cysteine ligase CoaBC [Cyclobacteriaceae bacterium]HRE67860.1 bifunctional phosphopantothenoylcysteine decarboxylase/phosphopantothenate--cysteine ligase CoaBC [Cyclobacteriaceae bacterium]HRF33858.1 bifunctional phosphopantothenoylcysteine decarboxylase/phosphopantothenate--cysteine lig
MPLAGKKILLGVCGSIAAYKSALLIRLLVKNGAEIKVIMTASAHDFITPLTLSTLSKNPVLTQFTKDQTGEWNNHVELGLWADALVLAPASANTLAKMANGICDSLLLATYLSARCPVFFAPAMDLDMWKHPATQSNLQKLITNGNKLIEPSHGELASGLVGTGRMAEPEQILETLHSFFKPGKLSGKKALVTAGPTYEALDPVRFIGNHSSGKMGFAIAEELYLQGAEVTLVSGPTHLADPAGVHVIRVNSAEEMFMASQQHFAHSDITIFAAAVADYKPAIKADQKIKKGSAPMVIELVKTYDIAAELGKQKKPGQITVGFALETENERTNAQSKLKNKNFDLIILNSLNDAGAGFGHDTNKISVLSPAGFKDFNLKSKKEVAADIVTTIIEYAYA